MKKASWCHECVHWEPGRLERYGSQSFFAETSCRREHRPRCYWGPVEADGLKRALGYKRRCEDFEAKDD